MSQQVRGPAGVPVQTGPGGPSRIPAGGELGLERLRLMVAYDGTDFCGWARQPGLRSVQGELESGLAAVLRVPSDFQVRVACAGRTDAGVHARGQVCHVDLPATVVAGVDLDRVAANLRGRLPADLTVGAIDNAPPEFDARWSALWRRYVYRVADPRSGFDPLLRRATLWQRRVLDVPAMAAAAAPFAGEHDFAAYCKARPGASSVRTIRDLRWQRQSDVIEMEIVADAFCHSMVRSLVAAFLQVGLGRWPVGRPAEVLAAAVRVPGGGTAPAHGLCLAEVGYPPDAALGAQAARSKRWRGAPTCG